MITHSELKKRLSYNPDTGVFTRLLYARGSVAGTINCKGYVAIMICKKLYLAHRLAWLYVHGAFPTKAIDHIDGNRANNAISNLREDAAQLNNQNRRNSQSNSNSGVLGVHFDSRKSKWVAQIRHSGKNRHIGVFDSADDAHAAYVKEKRIHHEFNTL